MLSKCSDSLFSSYTNVCYISLGQNKNLFVSISSLFKWQNFLSSVIGFRKSYKPAITSKFAYASNYDYAEYRVLFFNYD